MDEPASPEPRPAASGPGPTPALVPAQPQAPAEPPSTLAESPAPAAPRGPGVLSLAAWILFFAAQLSLALAPFVAAPGGEPARVLEPGLLDDPRMVAATIVASWLTFLVVAVLVWRARLTRADIGWTGLGVGRLIGWTALTVAALVATWVVAGLAFGEHLRIVSPLTRPPHGAAGWALWWALAATTGISEETVMRGYGIGLLRRLGANRWAAAAGVSAIFGCMHLYEGVHAVPVLALWGFLFALPLLRTGSLLPSILAHAVVNGIAPLFLYL